MHSVTAAALAWLLLTCRIHRIRGIGGRRIRDIATILVRVVYLAKGDTKESKTNKSVPFCFWSEKKIIQKRT